jgi:protoporphyrinogen oxidase
MSNNSGVKTVILGGGLTGITLARLLRENGEDVVVLEAEDSIGGLCRSRTENGFTFDTGGSHILFSRDCEVLSFMENVLGENIDHRSRNTKIYYKGHYVKYPFENGLYQLPKEDLLFCISEFIKTLVKVEKGEIPVPENFREWIYYTFGTGIAESYMVPYNEKIWNYPTDKMSHHWVDGRVPRPPIEDVIRSAIGIETEGYTHQSVFGYPVQGGIEALVKAIAAPVADAVLCRFPVTSLRREGDLWIVSDGDRTIIGDRIISTIPLQNLIPALEDVPGTVITAVRDLKYNSVACVYIGVKGDVPDISWLYIPDPETGLENRVSFPSNYSTDVAPPGHSSILAEITYNEGDSVSGMSDGEIIDHVTGSLERMGIISPGQVVYTGTDRQKFAYVVYDLHYLNNIRVIRDYFEQEQISLVGRFSQFEYLNMDGCIRSVIDFAGRDVCR